MIGVVVIALMGCRGGEGEGTLVGNPGNTKLQAAESSLLRHIEGAVNVDSVHAQHCDDPEDWESIDIDEIIDPINDNTDIPLPYGTWCLIELEVDPPIFIEGELDEGGAYYIEMDIEELVLWPSGGTEFNDNYFVLELAEPDWLSAEDILDAMEEDVAFIDDEAEIYDDLLFAMEERTTMFYDNDEDGTIDDDERDMVAASANETHDDDAESDDSESNDTADTGTTASGSVSGCSTIQHPMTKGMWVLTMLFGLTRRR